MIKNESSVCPGLVGWQDVTLEITNSLPDQARYHECFSLGLIGVAKEDSSDLQLGWRELKASPHRLCQFSKPVGKGTRKDGSHRLVGVLL